MKETSVAEIKKTFEDAGWKIGMLTVIGEPKRECDYGPPPEKSCGKAATHRHQQGSTNEDKDCDFFCDGHKCSDCKPLETK